MKTLISFGDFVETYYKLYQTDSKKIFSRLIPSASKNRVKKSWDSVTQIKSSNWWAIPHIQKRWNKLITGNEDTEYPEYLVNKYISGKNDLILLSPGCGTGGKELKFCKINNFKSIEAFDLSPGRIAIAKKNAEENGIANIIYTVIDITSFNFEKNKYDIVLFDSSLHHIKDLEFVLNKVYNSLKPDGILVINEYVGPSRFQWTEEQLKVSNEALKLLPDEYKRRWNLRKIKSKNYRPGILRMIISDPSESVRSQDILAEIYKRFTIVEEMPYGGNILHLALKDISHNFINEDEETSNLINRLIKIEDDFLSAGNKSDFIFGIYSKKNNSNID